MHDDKKIQNASFMLCAGSRSRRRSARRGSVWAAT